jgi:hypothetical protein
LSPLISWPSVAAWAGSYTREPANLQGRTLKFPHSRSPAFFLQPCVWL